MDLTTFLNSKKFRGCGNKEGAIRIFQLLQEDQLGQLETRRGRTSKVCVSTLHGLLSSINDQCISAIPV